MKLENNSSKMRSTTVLFVSRNGEIAMAGDGQVTLGETISKEPPAKSGAFLTALS
jgi:ATP-dependent HslUV protease subunit HslV